jgi:hypothetical protein
MAGVSAVTATLDPDLILRHAKRLWDHREQGFPAYTRQKWSEGTTLARCKALKDAEAMLRGTAPDDTGMTGNWPRTEEA